MNIIEIFDGTCRQGQSDLCTVRGLLSVRTAGAVGVSLSIESTADESALGKGWLLV